MTVSTSNYDMTGNQVVHNGVTLAYDTMTNVAIPTATQPSVVCGTGTPTYSAKKGTLYINLTGSSVSTRLYVNTDGATTWTNLTTAA